MQLDDKNFSAEEIRQKTNLETGRLSWPELQRHFARGVVIVVTGNLDLVEVARCFIQDNKASVEQWLNTGGIAHATDTDAQRWHETQAEFWAVVIAPWVLVQERNALTIR
ncbi:MAG: DUF2288 domain-containing protein [Gammaproteobacteria bacterium]|nr:DUF2288 domain-containing protein [Gammaproteobacteria bacterium]